MSNNMAEAWDSGEVSFASARFKVKVWNVDDPAQAFLEVAAAVTPFYDNGYQPLILSNVGPTKIIAPNLWEVPVEYSAPEAMANDDEESYSFEIGGGTAHITQSFETIASYAPSGITAPDFHGAINVTKDNVEGADVPIRSSQFSVTRKFDDNTVTQAFKDNLYNLACCVTNQPYRGRQPGEILFLGATGSKQGRAKWSITGKFVEIPNSTFDVGSIVGISKKGHDLLWIRYADDVDTTAKRIVKRPIAAYVERVLEYKDLNNLPF